MVCIYSPVSERISVWCLMSKLVHSINDCLKLYNDRASLNTDNYTSAYIYYDCIM